MSQKGPASRAGALRLHAYVLAGDPAFLVESVRSYYPIVDRLVVSYDEGGRSWAGAELPVEECLSLLRRADTLGKMRFVPGAFARPGRHALESETEQRRSALEEAASGADWVVQLDTDEVLGDPSAFLGSLQRAEHAGRDGLDYPMHVVYSSMSRRVYLERARSLWRVLAGYPGPVAVRAGTELRSGAPGRRVPLAGRLPEAQHRPLAPPRDAPVDQTVGSQAGIWHFSWARSEENLRAKAAWSGHAGDFDWDEAIGEWIWRRAHPWSSVLLAALRQPASAATPRWLRPVIVPASIAPVTVRAPLGDPSRRGRRRVAPPARRPWRLRRRAAKPGVTDHDPETRGPVPTPLGEAAAAPGLSAGELQRRALSGSLWTGLHTLVSVPVAMVANLVVARALGPVGFGSVAVLSLVLALAALVTNANVSGGVIQWGAAAEARGDGVAVDELLGRSLGWHLLVQFPILAVVVVLLGHGSGPLVLGVLLLSVLLPSALGGAALAISIENRTAAGARLTMLSSFATQVAVVVVALVTKGAVQVWAARLIVPALFLPANMLLIARSRRRAALRPLAPARFPPGFWRYGIPATMAGLVGSLAGSRSEIYVLEIFHQSVGVGVFSLAYGLAAHITAPVDAVLAPLVPATAGLLERAPERAQAGLLRALRFAAVLCGLILSALPALVAVLPLLYGPAYGQAALLLIPLGVVSALVSLSNPVQSFITARRQGRLLFRIGVLALAVDTALAFSLVPVLGVWGAATANMAAAAVGLPLALHSELPMTSLRLRTVLACAEAFLVGLVAMGAGLALAFLTPLPRLGAAAAALVGGLACFLVGLRLSGSGLAPGDREALLDVISRRARPLARPLLAVVGRR